MFFKDVLTYTGVIVPGIYRFKTIQSKDFYSKIFIMKYLSWDVGITHLAYCLLETKVSETKVPIQINGICCNIIDWKNIDLTNETKHVCNMCGKNARFYNLIDKKEHWWCGVHKRKQSNVQEKKKLNSNKISIDDLKLSLVKHLDKLPHLLDTDFVLIENQPSLINPKMKSIASSIYTYFLIRGKIDKNQHMTVRYMSPSNKLKVSRQLNQPHLTMEKIINTRGTETKDKYKLTKKLAVEYCKQILSNDELNLKLITSSTKKDDLADCMLQGMYYIIQKNKPKSVKTDYI